VPCLPPFTILDTTAARQPEHRCLVSFQRSHEPTTPLFILGHMRSYSSVLSHVLGSHPEIDGYCETHIRYRFGFDVHRLAWRVRRLIGKPLRGRFVLDKILHNYSLSASILDSPKTSAVLLLRQPVEAIQSIVHMGTHLDANERNANVVNAAAHYVQRVRELTRLAKRLRARAAFVESDSVLRRTDETLGFLSDFLGLASPLERRYQKFAKTGEPGYGDPSLTIHSGELRAHSASAARPRCSIPSALIARAVEAHAECLKAGNRYCVPLSVSAETRMVGRSVGMRSAASMEAAPHVSAYWSRY